MKGNRVVLKSYVCRWNRIQLLKTYIGYIEARDGDGSGRVGGWVGGLAVVAEYAKLSSFDTYSSEGKQP